MERTKYVINRVEDFLFFINLGQANGKTRLIVIMEKKTCYLANFATKSLKGSSRLMYFG